MTGARTKLLSPMNIAEARRITLDFSSHDPEVIQRIAAAAMREYDKIRQEQDLWPNGIVMNDRGFVYYPRFVPAWGTIRYRMDPRKAPGVSWFCWRCWVLRLRYRVWR